MAADLPPRSDPAKSQFFLPMAIARMPLGGIVIQFQEAVVEIGFEPLDAGDRIADGLRQRCFAGDTDELDAEPGIEIIKDRLDLGLSQSHPFIRRRSTRLFLDRVKLSDAPDRLFGDGGALGLLHINELAPDMRHAGNLVDTA